MKSRNEQIELMLLAGKTISMSQEDFDRWMEALGTYSQYTGGRLAAPDRQSFCCLGVEQHCRTGTVETGYPSDLSLKLPSGHYLLDRNIVYLGRYGSESTSPYCVAHSSEFAHLNDDGVGFHTLIPLLKEAFLPWE